MVDAGGEVDFGRLEGVVCRKLDGQKEDTARVRRVGLERGASAKLCIDRDGAACMYDAVPSRASHGNI